MNDFLPPKRPLSRNIQPAKPLVSSAPTAVPAKPQPPLLESKPQPLLLKKSNRRSLKKTIWWSIGGFLGLILLSATVLYGWYAISLNPVSAQATTKVRVEIVEGSSPAVIGQLLEEKKLIRSSTAFDIYTRLSNTRNKLQAGTYSLAASDSTQQIVEHLVSGNVDQFSITFLPGATLAENRAGLIKAGYGAEEVDAALKKTYNSPLFANKPASADLEGYIYGETYRFSASATVEQVLQATFDEFYKRVQENNLVADFEKQGLNLYQGITLASIIQREVPSATDQKQVAQIFYTRLAMGMELGSDVTYQYAAKKLGVTPSPSLDSPYNTRKYAGLPPGPIATPGLSALKAVAAPASGDYVYFLSGDDDITYYGRTNEEHEANIRNHCQAKCLLP